MRAEYVNSFIGAVKGVVENQIGKQLTMGKPTVNMQRLILMNVAIFIGVTRGIRGQVVLSMSEETSFKIVDSMMGSSGTQSLNDLSKSALGEMGNWILGRAAMALEQQGIKSNITPPTILTGTGM